MMRGKAVVEKLQQKWCKNHPGECYNATKLAACLFDVAKKLDIEKYACTGSIINNVYHRDGSINFHRARIFADYLGIDVSNIDTNNCAIKATPHLHTPEILTKRYQNAKERKFATVDFNLLALGFLGAKRNHNGIGGYQ